jgi:hypothetical protein
MARIERATSPLPRECSTTEPHGPNIPGAGEGNRTLVVSLEGFCSTIELHPPAASPAHRPHIGRQQETSQQPLHCTPLCYCTRRARLALTEVNLLAAVSAMTPTCDRHAAIDFAALCRSLGSAFTRNQSLLRLNWQRRRFCFVRIRRQIGGGGWIRTSVGISQQIYSLPPLAARAPLLQGTANYVGETRPCQTSDRLPGVLRAAQ